jgi:hypothetical protein
MLEDAVRNKSRECVEPFCRALVAKRWEEAQKMLAPWLQQEVTADLLRDVMKKARGTNPPPVDFDIDGNGSTLEDLMADRDPEPEADHGLAAYLEDDFSADFGAPSLAVSQDFKPAAFRGWFIVDFVPDPDLGAEVDYCTRLYLMVAEVSGKLRIGYVEPE